MHVLTVRSQPGNSSTGRLLSAGAARAACTHPLTPSSQCTSVQQSWSESHWLPERASVHLICVHTPNPMYGKLTSGFTLGAHRDASKAKAFKFLPGKISWQRIKICLRKPKCLVALILATPELSQWIKTTAKVKGQNLSRLPKALLKHFQAQGAARRKNT